MVSYGHLGPAPRMGDSAYGPVCPECGGRKAKQAHRCMSCRRAAAIPEDEQWRRWLGRNRERLAIAARETFRALPAEERAAKLARLAEWKRAHPDRVRATARRAKQRRRGMTRLDSAFAEILRADPCSYCGAPGEHGDHIVAIASGGEVGWVNLTSACATCNHAKSSRSLLQFLRERATCLPSG